uniref:Efflux RND transporter permease subunit n=1 Tax=Desulfacinum infernum TaxID=35837 RepID=A0A832A7P2_9BACT
MWIVRLALCRPYTFVVAALVLLVLSPFVLMRTPTDIFPQINIPVVSVIWLYNGLSAKEVEERIVYLSERQISTVVNDIEHIESTSYTGAGVIKVFLQPEASVSDAVAQITASGQSVMRLLPPGMSPPLIIRYNASSVPILQYSLASESLSEQELQDLAMNRVKVGLSTVRGTSIPTPFGGKARVVAVDIDPVALQAKNLSPMDVVAAFNAQNLLLPSGSVKIAETEYEVSLNSSPEVLQALNELPVKSINGTVITVGDVAHVHDGYQPQRNVVRLDGVRGVLLTVFKSGAASTLSVVDGVKKTMPRILAGLPPELKVKEFADQSLFVRAAVNGVIKEGLLAALLTAGMILLFLGSGRSAVIIALSIPLSILISLAVLSATGETINLMTLGGLALSVGILVDNATVVIENIHRQMGSGKTTVTAILEGAHEVALPTLVSTICICIVFVPMFLLKGVSRYLFVPLAQTVVFAVAASYVVSFTLVPTLAAWFYRHGPQASPCADAPFVPTVPKSFFAAMHHGFLSGFERFRAGYRRLLSLALAHRVFFSVCFLAFCAASWILVPHLGQDFFPTVDAGHFRLHLRAHGGTRIEETTRLVDRVEVAIREEIPAAELAGILDNIGIPSGGIPLAYSDSGVTGTNDADILVSLSHGHRAADRYVSRLRSRLSRDFPDTTFYFLPADIVNQTINFGLPAPFDIQIVGRQLEKNRAVAEKLAEEIRRIPGAVDVRVQQPADQPRLRFVVDRTKASQIGLTERDVASAVMLSLTGSSQTQPNYWLNPKSGIQYLVNIRVPEYRLDSFEALNTIPLSAAKTDKMGQILTNVASFERATGSPIFSHYGVQPVINIYGGVSGRDLGGVLADIKPHIDQVGKDLPKGSFISLRGQAETMYVGFVGLGIGMGLAMLFIYLLLVVFYQSWLDPLAIIAALPGALAGVLWGLHFTFTTVSVPALI